MRKSWWRRAFSLSLLAALALQGPGATLAEAIAHATSAPSHPLGAHYETPFIRHHSDHCLAGRILGQLFAGPSSRILRCVSPSSQSGPSSEVPTVHASVEYLPASRAPPPLSF